MLFGCFLWIVGFLVSFWSVCVVSSFLFQCSLLFVVNFSFSCRLRFVCSLVALCLLCVFFLPVFQLFRGCFCFLRALLFDCVRFFLIAF